MDFNETMRINLEFDKAREVREIVAKVYQHKVLSIGGNNISLVNPD